MASKLVKAVFCGSIMIHKYTLDRSINGSVLLGRSSKVKSLNFVIW